MLSLNADMDAAISDTPTSAPQPSAPSAPAVAPASAPSSAPSGGQSDPGGGPASDGTARDGTGRFVAKPIPPKTGGAKLLDGGFGNMPDDDFLTDSEKVGRKAARDLARGVKAGGSQLPAGAPSAPAAPKFSFGGQDWETQDQAEQSFRSLRGIHKSLETRTQVSERTTQQYYAQLSAAQARVAELEAAAKSGQSASPTPGAGQGAAPAEPSSDLYKSMGIDLGQFSAIAEQYGTEAAAAWLVRETAAKQREQLQQEMKQTFAPFVQMQERARQVGQVSNVFEQVANYTVQGQDGQPQYAYPELQDPQAAAYIGHFWKQLGFSDEAKHRPESLAAAVALYRDMTRGQASAQAPTTTTAAQPSHSNAAAAAAAVAQAVVQGNRGSDALTGGAPPSVRTSGSHSGFDVESFRRGIDQAGVNDAWLRR